MTYFISSKDSLLEKHIMSLGIGLGFIPILGVFLNLIRVQLYWPIFLVLSMGIPAYSLYLRFKKHKKINIGFKLNLKKSTLYILVALALTVVLFLVFHKGSFVYPYLEDDDPWFHAVNTKHVAQERTFSRTVDFSPSFDEPYPQGYVLLMGLLHQTNDNVIWTLKFFNALIISLSIIFFYFFACHFLDSRKKALFATFGLAIIPSFLSHFIWSSALAITLFFPALYSLEKARIEKSKGWSLVSALVIASILVTQPSNGFIFGMLFFTYWIITAITSRKFLWWIILPGIIGVALAVLVFWMPMLMKYGLIDTAAANTINLQGGLESGLKSIQTIGSGGGAAYSFNDFMIAKKQSKMDNPIGIGIMLFWLAVWSLLLVVFCFLRQYKRIFHSENRWKLIVVIWGVMSVLGILAGSLPIPALMPHRWWAILAIPVVLLCSEGFLAIGRVAERGRIPRLLVYILIIAGILWTSAYPKYVVETSYWPPGVNWGSMDEVRGYLSFVAPLPQDTKVFPLCSHEFKALAFDKLAEPWDPSYHEFKKTAFNRSAAQINAWLKSSGYEYLTLDSYCTRVHDINATNKKLVEIGNSSYFRYAGGNKGLYMFKVI